MKPPFRQNAAPESATAGLGRFHAEHLEFWESEFGRYGAGNWRLEKITELIRTFQVPGSSILDVGCNVGLLGQALPGYNYTGLELLVPADSTKRILPYDINSLTPPPGEEMFDCIVMSGVIEYSYAPRVLLSLLSARLKPGGLLMVSQTNFFFVSYLIRKLLNLQVTHYRTWNHTTDFRMLREWLAQEGMPVCQEFTLDTCFTYFGPLGRLWLRRLRRNRPALPDLLSKQNLFIARKLPKAFP